MKLPTTRAVLTTLASATLSAMLPMPSAHAAGSVEYEIRSGQDAMRLSLEWRETNQVRIEPHLDASRGGAGIQAWQILRDGKLFAVTVQGGKPMVMEVTSMMKMMAGKIGAQAGAGFNDVQHLNSLTATGRRETVAGVVGEVFLVDYQESGGKREQVEVVLSNHPTVREMTEAMVSFSATLAAALGQQDPEGGRRLRIEFDKRQLGMLRYGDTLKLTRVSSTAPAASRLELPAAPMAMPSMPGFNLPQGGVAQTQTERQAERQKERVSDRTQSEVDGAADRSVDKVLDKALGKLFGR